MNRRKFFSFLAAAPVAIPVLAKEQPPAWSEGLSPSQVNASAREMMAGAADWTPPAGKVWFKTEMDLATGAVREYWTSIEAYERHFKAMGRINGKVPDRFN